MKTKEEQQKQPYESPLWECILFMPNDILTESEEKNELEGDWKNQ